MRCRPVASILVLASLVLGGCSSAKDEAAPSDTVTLIGPIDPASYKLFRQQLRPETKRLLISSAGGRIAEGVEIGWLVREHDLEVVVSGLCLSACAHFILLPARKKRVLPDSLVAFHHTATAIVDQLEASGRSDLAAAYRPPARREQELYAEAGLSRMLLVEPLQQLSPICYRENPLDPPGSEYRTALFSKETFYIPAREDLERGGSSAFQGFWPDTLQDLQRILARHPKAKAMIKMKLRSSGADPAYAPRKLPVCPNTPDFQLPVPPGAAPPRS